MRPELRSLGLNWRYQIAQTGGHEIWEAIQTMVKNVTEAMLTPLPTFWRISKAFMEGRYKKVCRSLLPCSYVVNVLLDVIFVITQESQTMHDNGFGDYQTLRLATFRVLRVFGRGGDVARAWHCATRISEMLQLPYDRAPSNEDPWRDSRQRE